jgi:hypothetical protein
MAEKPLSPEPQSMKNIIPLISALFLSVFAPGLSAQSDDFPVLLQFQEEVFTSNAMYTGTLELSIDGKFERWIKIRNESGLEERYSTGTWATFVPERTLLLQTTLRKKTLYGQESFDDRYTVVPIEEAELILQEMEPWMPAPLPDYVQLGRPSKWRLSNTVVYSDYMSVIKSFTYGPGGESLQELSYSDRQYYIPKAFDGNRQTSWEWAMEDAEQKPYIELVLQEPVSAHKFYIDMQPKTRENMGTDAFVVKDYTLWVNGVAHTGSLNNRWNSFRFPLNPDGEGPVAVSSLKLRIDSFHEDTPYDVYEIKEMSFWPSLNTDKLNRSYYLRDVHKRFFYVDGEYIVNWS